MDTTVPENTTPEAEAAEENIPPQNEQLTIPWGMKEDDIYVDGSKPITGPRTIALSRLMPSNYNPRTQFDPEALQSLAASIKEHGILEPILVRPVPESRLTLDHSVREPITYTWLDTEKLDRANRTYTGHIFNRYPSEWDARDDLPFYEIVAGERRYRAARLAQVREVPVIIRNLTDAEAIQIAVTENLQRSDLDIFDTARGFRLLTQAGMTHAEAAVRVGCSQSKFTKTLGILRLPETVRQLVQERKLSPSHAQRLLSYADFPDVCSALAKLAVEKEWRASDLESPISYDVRGALNRTGTTVTIDSFKLRDRAYPCEECPYGAFRKSDSNYYSLCLKPEHLAELDKAWEDKRQAEAEKQIAIAREKYATALPVINSADAKKGKTASVKPDLPDIDKLDHKSYCRIFDRDRPSECTHDGDTPCPCRAAAISRYGGKTEVVQICTDPARYKRFQAQAEAQRKASREPDAKRDCGRAMKALCAPTDAMRQFIYANFIYREMGYLNDTQVIDQSAKLNGLLFDTKLMRCGSEKEEKAIKMLAEMTIDQQNLLLFTARLMKECRSYIESEYTARRQTEFFLQYVTEETEAA